MTKLSIVKRLELLERSNDGADDAQVLAWGQSVTDEELRQISNAGGRVPSVATRKTFVRAYEDADLYRIVRPFVDELRAKASL